MSVYFNSKASQGLLQFLNKKSATVNFAMSVYADFKVAFIAIQNHSTIKRQYRNVQNFELHPLLQQNNLLIGISYSIFLAANKERQTCAIYLNVTEIKVKLQCAIVSLYKKDLHFISLANSAMSVNKPNTNLRIYKTISYLVIFTEGECISKSHDEIYLTNIFRSNLYSKQYIQLDAGPLYFRSHCCAINLHIYKYTDMSCKLVIKNEVGFVKVKSSSGLF